MLFWEDVEPFGGGSCLVEGSPWLQALSCVTWLHLFPPKPFLLHCPLICDRRDLQTVCQKEPFLPSVFLVRNLVTEIRKIKGISLWFISWVCNHGLYSSNMTGCFFLLSFMPLYILFYICYKFVLAFYTCLGVCRASGAHCRFWRSGILAPYMKHDVHVGLRSCPTWNIIMEILPVVASLYCLNN